LKKASPSKYEVLIIIKPTIMNDEQKSIAASQWHLPSEAVTEEQPAGTPAPEITSPKTMPPDTVRKRGFFEAISHNGPHQSKLELLLRSYEEKARDRITDLEIYFEKKIQHLRNRIATSQARIDELKQKITATELYNEKDDAKLQQLLQEKLREENNLTDTQRQITDIRIRLGEAKAGIINKSLDDAESQVKKALNIHNIVYDETRLINRKKYEDEKDYLQQLAKSYQELHDYYKQRYEKVSKYLQVLDVDGISPITTGALTTIGTVSFGAAGFFFSTFAGNAGFGNQDMFYYLLDGVIRTAAGPTNALVKLAVLVSLLAVITLISLGCDALIYRLRRKRDDDIRHKFALGAQMSNKLDLLDYQLSLRSNNWYAFWLQLVPGIFIAGLIIISLSQNYKSSELNKINASSEGLIIGTSIAISLAGLIYLYIIKIVEPRLLKRYEANPTERINWMKANWELVAVVILFIVFSICIILIPYAVAGIAIPVDYQIRYAMLLFLAICLVGSMSFAYGVRNRGLIQTGRYLERVVKGLNSAIAYCSAPEAPDVHHALAPEHGNVLEHVLKQLSFKAAVNIGDGRTRRKRKSTGFFGDLMDALKRSKKNEEESTPEHLSSVTIMEPWEERYFPHIVDELKAKEFEYREKRSKLQSVQDSVTDHKTTRINTLRMQENEVALCGENIKECETQLELVMKERSDRMQQQREENDEIITNLLDGFHLGVLYRENGLGPKSAYFEQPAPVNLIPSK
jgi:NADH:ubiquinone oxidoreductase subunit 3 (subunit A)